MRRISDNRRPMGFTLVELIVALAISGLLVSVLFGPLKNIFLANESGLSSVVQSGDIHTALRSIEREVASAENFYDTNTVSDPLGPNNNADGTQWKWDGSTSGGGASSRVLIIGSYATTALPNLDPNGNRTLVPNNNDCTTPITNNVVYFVSSGTLYRRTLASTATPCPSYSIAQKTSCAAVVSNPACKGVDAAIIHNVTGFTIDYYSWPSSASPIGDEFTDNSVPQSAQSIVVTITVGSGTIATTNSLRISRVNGTYVGIPPHDPNKTGETTTGAYAYTIPGWSTYIDAVIIGGGAGGQWGGCGNGFGGKASAWKTISLHRGVDIPWTTATITGTVGLGGSVGAAGGNTTATATGWAGLTSTGGSGTNSLQTGAAPGDVTFNSQTYLGGAGGTGAGGAGGNPGAGGAGGSAGFFCVGGGSGGAGGRGEAWFFAYQ